MDIGVDSMTGRSKEVKSESSSHEKNKSTPTSLSELCEQLRERITLKSQHYSISHEDQQALSAVLTSELGMIWQDLKIPPVDTTLTHEEIVQLRCQTFSEVLRVCEELILQYLLLKDTFRKRGIFTDYANRSRLAAQLASDCTILLNVRSIRCRIVSGIKANRRVRSGAVPFDEGQQRAPRGNSLNTPYKHDLHVKRCLISTPREKTLADDLKEIEVNIGELDLQNVYDLLPWNVEAVACKIDTKGSTDGIPSLQKQEMDESPFQNRFRIKGCHSMPDLHRETLLEELEVAPLFRSSSLLVLLSTETNSSPEDQINPREDLKRLLQDSDCEDDTGLEMDLPPLIKAQGSYCCSRLQKLKQRLQRKMEEEKTERSNQKALAEKPLHPQGAVVSLVAPPQTILHMAPARLSDRVLPETIKLSMYPPVYNVFTKEINSASLAQMDQNLIEEEIKMKQVYEELRKSISTKYFSLDEDPRIEPVPTNATCCPNRNNNQKLFNPSLIRPNPHSISHRERMERALKRERPVDVSTRAYRAWFNWWKCQLSLDDYLNYISTQDSDYLSVIFHLYDSEDEEEDRHKLAQRQKKERRRYAKACTKLDRKEGNTSDSAKGESACLGEPGESPAAELSDGDQVQSRLERVWKALCLPEGQRLDMAIKYSSHEYRDHLREAITAWEQAARLIRRRELLLSQLEDFEREASDPSRFFQQGYQGSSMARMEEANRRENISSQISAVDKELSKIISNITTRFNDSITYKGRQYKEKMRWDRTEMLYWLQQERRVQSLERFAQGQTALPVRLPPLNHNQELNSFNHETAEDCIQKSHLREMNGTSSYNNT
ncbi:Coiled-coil domain-containing protein 87 [Triplophysa tibetana]|uniref:Coiled-coil domain-containing protein 87 n=1 Tax=Triplophysa tibetana TaxID=1572043 RepID=A0A5A9PGU3_9TELE|nr:Coiled-coil domain-containing protein 87 [Triplophysa tibetana]